MVYAQRDYDRSRGCVRAPSVYCAKEDTEKNVQQISKKRGGMQTQSGETPSMARGKTDKKRDEQRSLNSRNENFHYKKKTEHWHIKWKKLGDHTYFSGEKPSAVFSSWENTLVIRNALNEITPCADWYGSGGRVRRCGLFAVSMKC